MAGNKCPEGCRCGLHKQRPAGGKCPDGCKCKRHQRKRRPSTRKSISEGLIRHYRERGHLGDPDKKKCNRCHQWKHLPEGFYRKTATKLKSGDERQYYDSLCKICRVAYNREKLRQKSPEELSAMWRRYRQKWLRKFASQEEIRRYERERKAIYRDKKGLPPSSRRVAFEDEVKMDRVPLAQFVREEIKARGLSKADVAQRAQMDPSQFDRILSGKQATKKTKSGFTYMTKVDLNIVDRILLALDSEYMLTILYPE